MSLFACPAPCKYGFEHVGRRHRRDFVSAPRIFYLLKLACTDLLSKAQAVCERVQRLPTVIDRVAESQKQTQTNHSQKPSQDTAANAHPKGKAEPSQVHRRVHVALERAQATQDPFAVLPHPHWSNMTEFILLDLQDKVDRSDQSVVYPPLLFIA